MAYHADLSSLVNLLEDMMFHHRYPNSCVGALAVVKSLQEKLKSLKEFLEDYSFKGDMEEDTVKRKRYGLSSTGCHRTGNLP